MKKALLAGLIFILAGFMLVSGTFALPTWDEVFQVIEQLGNAGIPTHDETQLKVTLQATSDSQRLFPGGSASRTHTVKNEGNCNVYFRLAYAVQYDAESWSKLDVDFTYDTNYYTESDWTAITVDGTPFMMKVFTYQHTLITKTEAPSVTMKVAMDTSFTNDEIARYRSDFLQTQVLAIDPTPFLTQDGRQQQMPPIDALDLALPLDTLNPF